MYDIMIVEGFIYYLFLNNQMLEVNRITIENMEKTLINKIKLDKALKLAKITKNHTFILFKDNSYLMYNNESKASHNGALEKDAELSISKIDNKMTIYNQKSSILKLLEFDSNKLIAIDLAKAKETQDKQIIRDDAGFYVFYKNQSKYNLDRIEDSKLIHVSDFNADNVVLGKKMFFINKYTINKIEGIKGFINQSSFNVVNSKLVTFFKDESENLGDYDLTYAESNKN